MTPARNGTVLLWGAVAVGRVLFCYFVIARATCHAIEIHAGNDGLGKRRGRWGGGRGRAIVVILTTHNGRLLHLQTTGVQAKKGKRKMETNENEGKTTGVWNSTAVNNRSSLWLQKTNRTDAMFNHTGSCSSPLLQSSWATLSEAQKVQKQEKIQLTLAWFIQTGSNVHNLTCYNQKKDSQHMEDPGNHDSVHSRSCGSCSSSHSLQGLLQQTQGWKTAAQLSNEH